MILKLPIFFFFLPTLIFAAQASTRCERSCGSKHVPYPFGFSRGCHIHLNCSSEDQISIGEFPVHTMNEDNIKVIIQPTCNRSTQSLRRLYSKNYAPTATNAILLNNCNSTVSAATCSIPSIDVQTQFQSLKCDSNNSSSISCYSEEKFDGFLDYQNMTRRQCKYLLTSISVESFNHSGVSLDVQFVEVAWWLEGLCNCSNNANCSPIISPERRPGFRCLCKQGFEGDGYPAGTGCRKASSDCNPGKFISGKCGEKSRLAILIGGITAGACLMISLCIACCLKRRRSNCKAIRSTKLCLAQTKGISIPIYPYKEIEKATSGFSDKQRLGTGAFGTVYAGKLHNELWVAIKRIKHGDTDSIEQVINEIKLISSVSHPNLVRLLGCSIENGEQILVYEFMPNGTLCQHLQRERGDGLSWPIRLTIATETAQAIAHLHSAINPPIYHRDIKSSNILLDYNFKSKVADFGLSRLGRTEISHISTAPQGTPGYLDPQYHQNFQLSDKSDVYSFGVVLVEIITALKVVDFSRPPNEVNLAALASDRISKGRLDEIIDPFLQSHSDAWTVSSVHKVSELAFRCLAFDRDMRPSMIEVAAELEQMRTSRLEASEAINYTASTEICYCSSSSNNLREMPLGASVKKPGLDSRGLVEVQTGSSTSVDSMERMKDNSPVSVQDPWLSEHSSPSSNSLLSNVIQ
ncbi:putative Kinase [Melia azedarach]|uniref:Kinase n=1 Tax=Melia azedarach TaxID=155640 RepID=A0ACC1WRR0_MELAZ|nr:putative Kinase [Melia azedarach]